MSVAVVEALLDRPTPELAPRQPQPNVRTTARTTAQPTRVRPRRRGPGVGPSARPRRLRFVAPPVRPQACRGERVVVAPDQARTWRLTERGVSLVLVVGAALVAASVVVVGLTAFRVTSESYRPTHSAVAPVVVQP